MKTKVDGRERRVMKGGKSHEIPQIVLENEYAAVLPVSAGFYASRSWQGADHAGNTINARPGLLVPSTV